MSVIAKLNKQSEQTWVNLQKRLNEVQFPYEHLFNSDEVHKFVKNKAVSVGSCLGYFVPSLLTTTSFVLASSSARIQTSTHKQPLNLYIQSLLDILEQVTNCTLIYHTQQH